MNAQPDKPSNHLISKIFIIVPVLLIAAAVAALFMMRANNSEILFMAKVMGPVSNIYSIDVNGHLKKLTDNHLWRDVSPDISANGIITFSSNRYENPKVDIHQHAEDYNVFVMDTNGKKLRQITDSKDHEVFPKISPDGKRLAYLLRKKDGVELKATPLDHPDIKTIAAAAEIFDFSWSPDGKLLCYAEVTKTDSSLKIFNLESDKTETLLTTPLSVEGEDGKTIPQFQFALAQWSPDGNKIAYIQHPLSHTPRQLYVYDLPTKTDLKISPDPIQVQSPVDWSNNSHRLLYSALVDYKFYYDETTYKKVYKGGMHIFISDLKGNSKQLTQGDHLFKNPVFSPDEKQIAYLYADALDSRTLSLRIMAVDGTPIKALYDSVEQRSNLAWY